MFAALQTARDAVTDAEDTSFVFIWLLLNITDADTTAIDGRMLIASLPVYGKFQYYASGEQNDVPQKLAIGFSAFGQTQARLAASRR